MISNSEDKLSKMVEVTSHDRPVGKDILILVAVCIFGCFAFPEAIVSKFSLPLPSFSNRLPYVAPLLILLLWVLLTERSQTKKIIVPIAWPELFFLMNIAVWLLIEILDSSDGQSVSMFIMEFLAPQMWFFLFYYVFKLAVEKKGALQWLYVLFLLVPALYCLLQLLSYLNIIPGSWVPLEHIMRGDRPDAHHLNLTSYLAILGIWLILFIDGVWRRSSWVEWAHTVLFILFISVVAINRTRGALLILAVIFWFKLYGSLRKPARIMIWMLGVLSLCVLLVLLNDQIGLIPNKIDLINDDSLRQRLGSVFSALQNTSSNMFMGLGSSKSELLTFENLKPHTYHVRIFSAYGFFGLVAFMISISSLFYLIGKSWGVVTFSGFFLMNAIMLFESELHWWFAVIPVAVIISHQKHLKVMA